MKFIWLVKRVLHFYIHLNISAPLSFWLNPPITSIQYRFNPYNTLSLSPFCKEHMVFGQITAHFLHICTSVLIFMVNPFTYPYNTRDIRKILFHNLCLIQNIMNNLLFILLGSLYCDPFQKLNVPENILVILNIVPFLGEEWVNYEILFLVFF